MFKKHTLVNIPTFEEILFCHQTETLSQNRQCAVLVDLSLQNDTVPLLRTTGQYKFPAQSFSMRDKAIVHEITKYLPKNATFNHATLEVYDHHYKKMKYHTDQYLDIAKDTFIALVSIYENPFDPPSRSLCVQDKLTGIETEIEMTHNSVILFSYETNYKNLHKIIATQNNKNRWLGLTFRTCKTFLSLSKSCPRYPLAVRGATDSEKQELYHLKHRENVIAEDIYAHDHRLMTKNGVLYTLNLADMLTPNVCYYF